ncbi:MMPL family transporter [Listeria fleischmannii]|jgi:RND superfamily putative drug exporter|uniref:MMPL family transporter n=1 Tax=Listeria fleischmannii TaxID=1069827 RepID=UPI0016261EED|nr:MMPL family transporter [Listeria fleischmannii]MBC1419073.1 MMPL family transporter [Listeria fleischmannii]
MHHFLEKIADGVGGKKGRFITLSIWILAVILLQLFLPSANEYKDDAASDLKASEPSVIADKKVKEYFGSNSGTPLLITWYSQTGLTNEQLGEIQSLNASLTKKPVASQASTVPIEKMPPIVLKQQLSKDQTTFIQTILMDESATADELKTGMDEIKTRAEGIFGENPFNKKITNTSDLVARTTGPAGISVDATGLFQDADVSLLIATVLIVLIILLIIYRSPILALIPLIAVGFAYLIITPLLGFLGEQGFITYGSQGLSIMTVLLFGAGTDYCLFLITRYRSVLRHEENRYKAFKVAFSGTAGAILLSGLTVMVALLMLLAAQYGSFHNFAIPFSLAILIMLISSLTLVPALLGLFGRISFWPFIPHPTKKHKKENQFWNRVGKLATKHPIMVTILALLILGGAALQTTNVAYTYDTLSTFPEDMPSREGFKLISDHYGAGYLAKVEVLAENPTDDLKQELENIKGVQTVSFPEKSKENRNIVKYDIVLSMNPYSNEAMNVIPKIKKVGGAEATKAYVAGQTAAQYDSRAVTEHDEKVIIPLVIALISILLLTYLRSLTATLYLVLSVLISYASAIGLGWLILHHGFGVTAISGLIPLYAFVFIVALGEDYNIFMISSIWKNTKKWPLRKAVQEGVHQTGGVITSAGVILAATFLVLTTLPINLLVQFGLITAIGILLDTFLVRPLLVPAVTTLFGRWAFWPGKKYKTVTKD